MKQSLFGAFKPLLPDFYDHRRSYALGIACLLVVDAAQILIPQWTRRAINLLQGGSFVWLDIVRLCAAMVLTMLVIALGRFFWRYFIHGASRRIETRLREKLFAHLLELDSNFYQKNNTGDLMARSTNDINAVRMAIGWGFVAGIDGTVMAAGILIMIFVQAPHIAPWVLLPVPLITLLIALFGRAVGRRFKLAQETYSAMSGLVQESFAGVRVIKSFVREETFIEKARAANRDYVTANMGVIRVHGLFFPLIMFLAGLTTLIVIFFGGRSVVRGEMAVGDLVSLIAYIQMLIWPMFGAGFTVNMIQRGAVSMRRINEVLDTEPEIKDVSFTPPPAKPSAPAVELRSLSFAYPGGAEALHDISLSVNKGEWLGVFGRTGSGKSTLVKLLPRLFDAPPGSIFICGRDVREIPLAELRGIFGMAPQDGFLFSDSIISNILYGTETEVPVSDAVRLAALEKDLALLKDGGQTLIGERGLTLSGGQKQRVTIARAAIIEPEILILDDSLSACDAETEKTIIRNLEEARAGKTTIIVSHRVSAFRSATRVAVLDSGRLAEYGPPGDLLAADGYYAKTARLQSLGARGRA